MTPFHRLNYNYIYYLVMPWFNPFIVIDVFQCRIDTKNMYNDERVQSRHTFRY